MLLHSSLKESEGWLQQHCFVHKSHSGNHVAFKHVVHQCLIFIEDCLIFKGIITVFIKHITATEIHC